MDLEVRQIVFWGCFGYDRYSLQVMFIDTMLSASTGFGLSTSDDRISSSSMTSQSLGPVLALHFPPTKNEYLPLV